jgi:uncharacterized protein (DUF885 family)
MNRAQVRRIARILGYGSAALLGITACVGLWLWHGPLPINWFFNRAFVKIAVHSPELLSQLRLLEPMGITFHQDELDDASIAADDRAIETLRAIDAELHGYERASLDAQQQLSYDIAEWLSTRGIAAAERWRFHNYPVNQLFGVQNGFPSFMDSAHQVHDEIDAKDYVVRLTKVRKKFEQVMEGLKVREQKGIIPPTFVIEKVLAEMVAFVGTAPDANILYVSFQKKLDKTKLSTDKKTRLLNDAKRAINEQVYPAYRIFITYFQALKPKSNTDAGVWKLPDGDAYYADVLELSTSTKRSAKDIHDTGLAEVARIQAEMRAILSAQGRDTAQSIGAIMRALNEEPAFLFSDDDKGRAEILATYKKIIAEVSAGLGPWFNLKPAIGVDVERVPVFKEKTAPGAYYEQPPFDGSKKGTFFANLYDIKATPKFGMRTLAYHEAVPGHHFQIAIAQEQKDLPMFRRMGPFTAYVEGWALYAERLAWEAGFQKDPYDDLGRLQAELMRAVRLVVDTGIHAQRWTREQAITYMSDNTGMAESNVIAEVERYIVMPGQACAYKVGMMEILRLRENAKQTLGPKFDIRAFHDLVLRNGAMPLFLLDRTVAAWVAKIKAA